MKPGRDRRITKRNLLKEFVKTHPLFKLDHVHRIASDYSILICSVTNQSDFFDSETFVHSTHNSWKEAGQKGKYCLIILAGGCCDTSTGTASYVRTPVEIAYKGVLLRWPH